MLLPSLGASPRLISTYGVAVAPTASLVAYIDSQGDVVVENLDGTDQRVLVPSADPTAVSPAIDVAGFSPDQNSVLIADHSTYPNAFEIVAVADGSMSTVPNAFFGGTPYGSPNFLGASLFSSDGSELLLQSTTNLIAVTLATGATRPIATFGINQSSGGAVFLDDAHVLWLRVDDESGGDEGAFALSVHVAGPGPTEDLVLDPPTSTRPLLLTIAISPAGFIALPSDVVMMQPDGTVLAENEMDGNGGFVVDNILGLTADGTGIVTSSNDGEVSYFDMEGASRSIITTATNTNGLLAPFSAYTTAE